MLNFKMYIDNQFVDAESGKTFDVFNPATEEVIAKVPLGDKRDVDKAVAAAKRAFPIWSKMPQMQRNGILNKLADLLMGIGKELTELEQLDHGYPAKKVGMIGMMPGMMIRGSVGQAGAVTGETAAWRPNANIYMQYGPIGVCALITPWNVPLTMVASKLGPCIATGNTCVIKPPSVDCLAALKLAEALAKSDLPPGVVNIVTGPGTTAGEALASHRDVRMISFTGSSETGKRLMELGSVNVKRLSMELGGKNPSIVFDDADVDAAVETTVRSQYNNVGQICGSPGRYYLHEKIHDEFVKKFVELSKKVITGDPKDPNTQMGPLVSKEHRDKVEAYIKSGLDEGATLVLGGNRPTTPPMDKGYYCLPTVFTNVTQNMKIAREEIFGPVAVILKPFKTEKEVIELANDTRYGLCCDVWTRDLARGIRMGYEIKVGDYFVNEHQLADGMPWGGLKESGIGRSGSMMGIKEYLQQKVIYVDLSEVKHRPQNVM